MGKNVSGWPAMEPREFSRTCIADCLGLLDSKPCPFNPHSRNVTIFKNFTKHSIDYYKNIEQGSFKKYSPFSCEQNLYMLQFKILSVREQLKKPFPLIITKRSLPAILKLGT